MALVSNDDRDHGTGADTAILLVVGTGGFTHAGLRAPSYTLTYPILITRPFWVISMRP